MPKLYTFTSKYTAKDEHIRVYGIFKRKKQFDDISEFVNMKIV